MLNAKIQETIEYHTSMLAKNFNLQTTDKDDVRQELTLKILEVMEDFQEGNASLVTYAKTCLANKAADLARQFQNASPFANADGLLNLDEVEDDYRRQADPNESYQPLTIGMGSSLEQLITSTHEHDLDLKLDIEAMLEKLSPRQKMICKMLMAGHTQEEVAKKLQCSQPTICREIQHVRFMFEKNLLRYE